MNWRIERKNKIIAQEVLRRAVRLWGDSTLRCASHSLIYFTKSSSSVLNLSEILQAAPQIVLSTFESYGGKCIYERCYWGVLGGGKLMKMHRW